MKKLHKRISKKNTNELRLELAHAHMIIALLATAIVALLSLGVIQPISFDATLSAFSVALLVIVVIFSLSMSITLYQNK